MNIAGSLARPMPDLRTAQTQSVSGAFLPRSLSAWLGLVAGVSVVWLLALTGATPTYDTQLPAPTGRETYSQVTPVSVAGVERVIEPLPGGNEGVQGSRVRYGDIALIEIARLPTQDAIDRYVASQLQPRLARYEQREGLQAIDGWQLRAEGQVGRLHGWQNEEWLFVIEASTQAVFDEIVDQFAYIRRY